MRDDVVSVAQMLDLVLAELRAAEAWRRLMTAALNHHGGHLGSSVERAGLVVLMVELRDATSDDFGQLVAAATVASQHGQYLEHFTSGPRWFGNGVDSVDLAAVMAELDLWLGPALPPCVVRLGADDARALLAELLARGAPGASISLARYPASGTGSHWAYLQVSGHAPEGYRKSVSSDGLVGKAGGLLLESWPNIVAECWLPAL